MTIETDNLSFILHAPGECSYRHRPVPLLEPHDVCIQVHYTGICGSDVHYWKHGSVGQYKVTKPMVLGHESSGVVIALGRSVDSLTIGDRVALEPGTPCRRCARCRGGKYNLCPEMEFAATPPVDGTLSKYYTLPADFCHRLADHVSLQEGALVEPLAVAVHVVRQADVKPDQSVVVFGAGPVGSLCCAVAKVFGASKIVCVDLSQERLNFVKAYAATHTFVPRQESPNQAARAILTECGITEEGADVAIDATGAASCIQTCVYVVKNGGTYVQAGMGTSELMFPIGALCGKELTVKGSFRYQEGDYALAVSMLARRKISVRELITSVFKFEEAEKAFQTASQGIGIKALIAGQDVVAGAK